MSTRFAVKFYNQTPNEDAAPGEWPVETNPLAEGVSAPEGYTEMTAEELAAYKAPIQAAFDSWYTLKTNFEIEKRQRRGGIKARMEWGTEIVMDFRDYAVAKNIGLADSLALMTALSGILPHLSLGLLGPAAYILNAVGANSFLDGAMDGATIGVEVAEGMTVKQYFRAKILEGNV